MTARVGAFWVFGSLLVVPASLFAQAADGNCYAEKMGCLTSDHLPEGARLAQAGVLVDPLALAGIPQFEATHSSSTVPCTDASLPTVGCPDLLTDASAMRPFVVLQTFSAASCDVVEGETQAGTRTLLRFTFTTPNFGDGDLRVGAWAQHPEWFVYSACHEHYHFREYADYRLWTIDGYLAWTEARLDEPDATPSEVFAAHPELLAQFVAGNKEGFCVVDIRIYVPLPASYFSCSENQGISVGWADEYHWTLPGQYVDITGVPGGVYVLEAEVNSERIFVETDYSNNGAALLVRI